MHFECKICNQILKIKRFSRFAKGLSYLAIVVKNVKEKYGKDYGLKNESGIRELHLHLVLFSQFLSFNEKQISVKSAQLADFPLV